MSRAGAGAVAVSLLATALLLVAGYLNKDRCVGPGFGPQGQTEPTVAVRQYTDVCYSDLQLLWDTRDLGRHRFPYVDGGRDRDGRLTGGSVEYPVLTGLLIWAGALFAHNDAQFLLFTALLLAPFGLFTGWALGRLTRWRALIWALGPPLVLYACHNWDLAVVGVTVGGFYVLYRGWGRLGAARPLQQRAVAAAVLFGIGFALKLYPAMFVLALACYVGSWRAAWRVIGAAAGTAVLVNLPFMVFGFRGWWASFAFQASRATDVTTNSVWFWGLRPWSDPANIGVQRLINIASPIAVLLGIGLALWLGRRIARRNGEYPVLGVCAAMLCAFLLLHKVHSPQYTLWLVPFFVLLRVRAGWVIAYLLADLALGIGLFRWFGNVNAGIYDGLDAQAVMIGVWGQAALLVGLFVAFLHARPAVREPTCPVVTAAARSG